MHTILLEVLQVERRITRDTIAAMTDGDIAFRPNADHMTFADHALHLISAQETLWEALQNGTWDWNRGIDSAGYPTMAAVLARFDDMHASEIAHYRDLDRSDFERPVQTSWGPPEPVLQLLVSFLAHEAHHRGQMAVYLVLKGMTPPAY